MHSSERLNQFVQNNGGSVLYLDENLILQKELREETIFWGSVYGSEFVEMPDTAFTSEAAYRTWCWKTAGMMPEKRKDAFDKYIRSKMIDATVRPTLPGTEYAAEVDDVIDAILESHRYGVARPQDLDEEGVNQLSKGSMLWIETLPDSTSGKELIIKIKPFMRKVNSFEAVGNTQGKIKRKDVCKRLVHYGRQVDDRGGTINRLRSVYALPIEVLENGLDGITEK